jgi:hypothetical protein
MNFTAPVSIDETTRILNSHEQTIPVLPDTVVEILRSSRTAQVQFSVKRKWKWRRNWYQYSVVELNGTLTATSDKQTAVTAHIKLGIAFYVVLGFVVFLPLLWGNSRNGWFSWFISIVIVLLLSLDAYVIYKVIRGLKTGLRYR